MRREYYCFTLSKLDNSVDIVRTAELLTWDLRSRAEDRMGNLHHVYLIFKLKLDEIS